LQFAQLIKRIIPFQIASTLLEKHPSFSGVMMTSLYRTSTNPGGYNSTAHVTPTGYYIPLRQQLQASRTEIVAVCPTNYAMPPRRYHRDYHDRVKALRTEEPPPRCRFAKLPAIRPQSTPVTPSHSPRHATTRLRFLPSLMWCGLLHAESYSDR
jgi:hypothetical protein